MGFLKGLLGVLNGAKSWTGPIFIFIAPIPTAGFDPTEDCVLLAVYSILRHRKHT